MATIKNALTKLNKAGFEIEQTNVTIKAIKGHEAIEIRHNLGSDQIGTIRTRRISDHDDMQSDYFAGCFVDNISQAISMADSMNRN
tara:strand:- start:4117 stop:4374 length:258 start_codon:yes stop_codon:yes gene_type:complete